MALPENEAEVIAVLKTCHRLGVPIVPRGAGTGLSGGACRLPRACCCRRPSSNRILKLDPFARTAVVQPGVRNLAISEAAAPHGLFYAPDPSSQIACTIGGNVAENAGGVHCLKYGLTVHNSCACEMVTIEGEVLELGGAALDAPGLRPDGAVTGSEGLLGVVTEVTVKLHAASRRPARVIMASFDDVREAGDAVAASSPPASFPAGLEMMDKTCDRAGRAVRPRRLRPRRRGDPAVRVGRRRRGSGRRDRAGGRDAAKAGGAHPHAGIAADEAERLRFWAGRKAAFPAVGRISPDYYCMDGTIPRRRLPEVLARIAGDVPGIRPACAPMSSMPATAICIR